MMLGDLWLKKQYIQLYDEEMQLLVGEHGLGQMA